MKKLAPIHPGEILLEDFLKPMGISQYRLATHLVIACLIFSGCVWIMRALAPHSDDPIPSRGAHKMAAMVPGSV